MATPTWNIDFAHSSIGFTVRHLVVSKVHGSFTRWTGKLDLNDDLTRSSIDVEIDAASIHTNEEKRDGHLRSADFLDAERFPKLTFKSKRVERAGEDVYKITGDLTIKDVTREVSLEVEELGRVADPWGSTHWAFSAKAAIDRRDFGLRWNQVLEAGGVLVGDKVEIKLEFEAVAALAKAA